MRHHTVAAVSLAAVFIVAPAHAQQKAGPPQALDGIDPVVLIQQGKEVFGKAQFAVVRGGFEYQFSSAETKAAFEGDPAKYEIQLNGSCARMGGGVGGNPSDFAVVGGRIYIFGSDDCHKRFVAAPAKFIPKPAPPMPADAAALAQGRTLVERAVAALGGSAAIDAVRTYAESSTQIQKRPTGDVPVTSKTTWRFPGDIRFERTMTVQGKEMTNANLITPEGGWGIGGNGRVYTQNPASRATNELEFSRQLVPLLRTRSNAAFKAAAVGKATVDGTEVERVRIQNGIVDVTLGIDTKANRVHSVSFTGRNLNAEIGEYTLLLGDYRQVSGLTLPFQIRALFDGAPDEYRSVKFDAVTVNAPVDPALFEAPKGEAK
jgi:YHS domain-containing protein